MNRSRARFPAALLLVVVLTLLLPPPAHAQPSIARPHPDGRRIAAPDGRPLFVVGYNYEGPADRAWNMWGRFDLALIEADLARARAGGANTVRLFVQEPLAAAIKAGDFAMLDAVLDVAARHGLFVLLTLGDYAERDLTAVAAVNEQIARRYSANPTILAYDLRNEPQFLHLASATYPPGVTPPLQRADLVPIYGERVARDALTAYRAGGSGRVLPPWWSDDQVYAYANNLAYYREFLAAAEMWAGAAPGRAVVDYPATPEAAGWQPLWAALDETLAAWIGVLAAPIRAADPPRMVTVGWSSLLFARLPSNGALLDVVSLHRFPRPGPGGVQQTLDLAAALRRAHPGRPLLLEELGYATAEVDEQGAAILELATALRAYSEGYAGFLKWMLTDLPPVGSPREDSFGAVRLDGSAKPSLIALGVLGAYLASTQAPPGGQVEVWSSGGQFGYSYVAADAVFLGGPGGGGGGVGVTFDSPGQLIARKDGAVELLATRPADVTLNLRELMPPWTGGEPALLAFDGGGWVPAPAARAGDELRFPMRAETPYRVVIPRLTEPAQPGAGCRHFPETGHNLCGAFLRHWEQRGGLAIFGYPLSEEFQELSRQDGRVYTVQYFERNRFEYHPELAGTPYEVLLGLLGNDLAAGRRAEGPFLPVAQPPDAAYFPETGHTLRGAFRTYWERNGGLAIFGFPISEEFQEYNPADGRVYTVQYFERNRFEYHPELAGTPYEVLLGLLGSQTVDGRGWR
jgi:hypothetical protein